MPRFTSPYDSASLFYRDFIPDPQFNGVDIAPPSTSKITSEHKNVTLVFLHGWPMSSLMYEHLLVPLCQDHKFRCIAPDRRGFGKSEWNGRGCNDAAKSIITYETFADDVAFLLKDLAVGDFAFIGASMGCGESLLAWERSAYVREHCKGFIWMGTGLPYLVQTDINPTAPPLELWHSIMNGLRTSRSEFVTASLPGVFGIPAGCVVPAKTLEHFERIVAQADGLAIERTCQILVHRDFTPLVKQLGEQGKEGVRVLLIHGDSDKSAPYECSAGVVKEMVPRAEAKIYEKAAHGMYLTHANQVLQDILDFVGGVSGEQRN